MDAVYLFDMDGTLIDSEVIWCEAIQVALSQRGVVLALDEVWDIEMGRSWKDIFGTIKRRWPDVFDTIEDMGKVTGKYYEDVIATRDIGIHSSLDLLRRLGASGVQVYIVTGSARKRVEQVAREFQLADALTGIIACEDYGRGKPDPDCYLMAARAAGVTPEKCVVFEDALPGVLAAKRAGMWCVALNRTGKDVPALSRLADVTLTDLGEFRPEMFDGRLPGRVEQHRVALGLGGNIGDTEKLFSRACQLLDRGGLTDMVLSSLLRTRAVDCVPGTPDFLNGALTGIWDGSAAELLELTQGIERQLGRPSEHSSRESRTLDLDLLLVDELVLKRPELTVPHPRLLERRFALEPLAEIAGDWRIATAGMTVRQALERLG